MDDGSDISPSHDADLAPPPPPPPTAPPAPPRRRPLLGRRGATAALAGGLVAGGIAGGYMITQAATPSPSASASAAPSTTAPAEPAHPGGDCGPGGAGGAGRAEDQQVVASALGLTTAQLHTEESAGKTIAAIATQHHVAVAKVVSALVVSENAEIDKRVASGQITATQGTQLKAMTTQRVTDEVNGTHPAGGPHDGPAPDGPTN
jgi:hypothetical protein